MKLLPGSFCLLILFLPHFVHSQVLHGTVTDAHTGRPVKGARVYLKNGVEEGESNYRGVFSLKGLDPGVNTWVVLHPNYEPVERETVYQEGGDSVFVSVKIKGSIRLLHKDAVESTARRPRAAFYIPEAVSVYNAQQFRHLAPGSTYDALMDMPGMWGTQTQAAGGNPIIRGLSGNRTLLLVDGIRVHTQSMANQLGTGLALLDPLGIDRIEVSQGGGSAQYGSGAMGGAIHLFSQSPHYNGKGLKVGGEVLGRYRSRNLERSLRTQLSLSNNIFALSGGFTNRQMGHVFGADGTQIIPSDYQQRAFDIKAKTKLGKRHEVSLVYQSVEVKELDETAKVAVGEYLSDVWGPMDRKLAYARLTSYFDNPWVRRVRLTGAFQHTAYEENRKLPESPWLPTFQDQLDTWTGTLEVYTQPNLYWNIVSGLEFYQDELQSQAFQLHTQNGAIEAIRSRFLDGSRGRNMSIYSMHTLDIVKLRLSFGGRANANMIQANDPLYGDYNLQAQAVVGNISALYPLNQYVHLTSSFNTGYRLPDIADLSGFGDQGQHFRAPSDSLQAERSFSSQIGLKAQTSQFSGSVVFYRTQLTDLIDEVPGTFQGQSSYQGLPVFQQINIAQAYVHGVEAALEVPFTPAIAIYGTLVYTYGESLTDRDALSSIPPLNGRLGMRYRNKHGFWSRLEWLRSAAQSRLSQADRENPFIGPLGTPSWSVVNLHLGYDFNWGYATLGLQNVLDESYRIHGSALPGLGRTVLLSMQLGF